MAKKVAPKHVESEDQGQGAPEAGEADGGKIVSKAEAIRRALAGGIESPEEGTDFIRKTFGIEVSRQHFSATKSQIKSKEGSKAPKGKPGRKPKAAASQAVEGYLAPPPKPQAGDSQPDLLAAMEAMKPLVAALGVDKVKRIADLLG